MRVEEITAKAPVYLPMAIVGASALYLAVQFGKWNLRRVAELRAADRRAAATLLACFGLGVGGAGTAISYVTITAGQNIVNQLADPQTRDQVWSKGKRICELALSSTMAAVGTLVASYGCFCSARYLIRGLASYQRLWLTIPGAFIIGTVHLTAFIWTCAIGCIGIYELAERFFQPAG